MSRRENRGVGVSLVMPLLAALTVPASAAAERRTLDVTSAPPGIVVEARLQELPTSPACQGRKRTWVTTRYRVERVLSHERVGRLRPNTLIAVVHACPERSRGPSRIGRGKAGPLRVGQRHRLRLEVLTTATSPNTLIDPAPDDGLPRFRARRTDKAEGLPLVIVKARGVGRAHKLRFGRREIIVGRRFDADVMLRDPRIAPWHFVLRIRGDKLVVQPLGQAIVRIDGKPVPRSGSVITYLNHITAGPYTVTASLFTAKDLRSAAGRRRRRRRRR